MRTLLESRQALLREQLASARTRLQALEQERQALAVQVLRLEGALALVEELLAAQTTDGIVQGDTRCGSRS